MLTQPSVGRSSETRNPTADARAEFARVGENSMVADGKSLQITQSLAKAEDAKHRNKAQVPGRDAYAPPHAGIRNRLEVTDQIEIGCGRNALAHREEAVSPTSPRLTVPTRDFGTDFRSALAAEIAELVCR
jgi:hypothetical protein